MTHYGSHWVSDCTWLRHNPDGKFSQTDDYPAEMYRFGVPEVMGRTVRALVFAKGQVYVDAIFDDCRSLALCPEDVQQAYQEYCKRLVDAAIETPAGQDPQRRNEQ